MHSKVPGTREPETPMHPDPAARADRQAPSNPRTKPTSPAPATLRDYAGKPSSNVQMQLPPTPPREQSPWPGTPATPIHANSNWQSRMPLAQAQTMPANSATRMSKGGGPEANPTTEPQATNATTTIRAFLRVRDPAATPQTTRPGPATKAIPPAKDHEHG